MQLCRDDDAPFRATMFHAVGLNAMNAADTSRDRLEKSTSVDSELAMFEVVKVVEVVVDVSEKGRTPVWTLHARQAPNLSRERARAQPMNSDWMRDNVWSYLASYSHSCLLQLSPPTFHDQHVAVGTVSEREIWHIKHPVAKEGRVGPYMAMTYPQ